MDKGRLEAFSDGVIAIIITIMVLEMRVPHGEEWSSLLPLIPVFVSYVLSFANLGIWWNNHHHMLKAAHRIDGSVLWANLHLLFWLSLMPFATAWMGENHFARAPVALYGGDLFMSGVAYYILQHRLIAVNGKDSPIAIAVGRTDVKGKISPVLYFIGIVSAFFVPLVSMACYVAVAVMWLVPDRRMERVVHED
jgi:TMEM175 potassium channel family protein